MAQRSDQVGAREPRPRPLAIAVIATAMLGGSCTLQSVFSEQAEPTQAQIEKTLEPLTTGRSQDERTRLFGAVEEFAKQKVHLAAQMQPFHLGFGVLLLAAYGFSLLFGLRTLKFFRQAPAQLSLSSLCVIIARAAVAAVDVAQAQKLRPAMVAFAKVAQPPPGSELSPAAAAQLIDATAVAIGWGAVALELARAIVVCALFTVAWRYFQRRDVVAFFERRSPAGPLE